MSEKCTMKNPRQSCFTRKCLSSINLKEDLNKTDYKNYDLLTLAFVAF